MPSAKRSIATDGRHTKEVENVLKPDLGGSIDDIRARASQIVKLSVDPKGGAPAQPSDGLLYGLIQSGKTSVITVAAGMAADNGFDCIVVLTSDIDLLYDQTVDRVRKALRGLSVLGKNDWKDAERFARQIRTPPFVVVCSKNGSKLQSLLNAFKTAKSKKLSVFLIDDEADQASLNTKASTGTGVLSPINKVITDFRDYFPVNTYLQVTATPQALFLQRPDNRYRPSFSVITEPGPGYVGGEDFFGPRSAKLLRPVDLSEVSQLQATNQPSPTGKIPDGLKKAVYAFLVGASARVITDSTYQGGFAFLCHVSMNKGDHAHIVKLLDNFKEEMITTIGSPSSIKYKTLMRELKVAYDDLATTDSSLPSFKQVVEKIEFYIKGANIKLINATSNEEIKLDAIFNLFVGGNKLGRGVTIKNLLVSYYGRNPKRPNADTVLQHARMYGYRKKDVGVTRLFLPTQLADRFRSIHQMETALRDLLKKFPDGSFEGIYVSNPLQATRRNVLDPTSLGLYVAGGSYNPPYPLRTADIKKNTKWIDAELAGVSDSSGPQLVSLDRVIALLEKCEPDPEEDPQLWNLKALKAAVQTLKTVRKSDQAYLVVRRNRNLQQPRRETQGILAGGEDNLAPRDKPTLFLFRQNANGDEEAVWWPQLRFPDGNYVLAFSFDW